MYAIIRSGGKQARVSEGDVLDVERLRGAEGEVTFTPLLIVADDGTVISGRDELGDARVVAEVVGGSVGPKVDIFKYKAKTGYRRRQGHRQKYTQIRVTKIEAPGVKPASGKKVAAKEPAAEEAEETAPEAAEAPAATVEEAAPAAEKPATPATKTTADKTTADETPADKTPAKKTTAKKTTGKKKGAETAAAPTTEDEES